MSVIKIFNSTGDHNYPIIRPTLDLNFARTKTIDPRITFTRNSGGTYVGADGLIKYAGVNEARFDHNPLTKESLGLLIEESRVNLDTASATPSINWSASNGSWSTVTGITAPDGSTSVNLFTENTSNTTHGSGRFYDNTYTGHALSFFVKSNGRNRFYINLDTPAGISNQALVNLSSGTVTPVSTGLRSYKLVPYPNNWYRLEIVSGSGNRGYISIDLANDTNNTTYTGNGSGIYFWGMQYEKGVSFCTSYIPTSGSAVTRSADVASITGTNFSSWFNPTEGSFISNSQWNGTSLYGNAFIWAIDNGSTSQRYAFYSPTNTTRTLYTESSSGRIDISAPSNSSTKVAFSYSEKQQTVFRGGFTGGSSTNIYPIGLNRFTFTPYESAISAAPGSIHHSNLTYYPKRLSNAQLQVLTQS